MNTPHEQAVAWHYLPADEAAARLEASCENGLGADEVARRRAQHGDNRITPRAGKGPLLRFALQFVQPLVLVLLLAGTVTAILGEWVDSGVIFGVTLINAVIGFIQEGRAESALAALARSVTSEVTVLRGGCKQRLSSTELVPGDVVLLAAGDKVPADLRLFRAKDLQAIEAALTGESTAVAKHDEALPEDTLLAERCNMAYAGTVMISGQGAGVVVATGDRTETGRISRLIAETPDLTTPLTRKMAVFSNWLLIAIGSAGRAHLCRRHVARRIGFCHVHGRGGARGRRHPRRAAGGDDHHPGDRRLAHGQTAGDHPQAAGGRDAGQHDRHLFGQDRHPDREPDDRARACTPAAFARRSAAAVTRPMARSATAARSRRPARMPAGRRAVQRCWSGKSDRHWEVVGDPTEGALLVVARKAGLDERTLQKIFPRLDEIPFDSARQYMATLHEIEGVRLAYFKGALEQLLPRSREHARRQGLAVPLRPKRSSARPQHGGRRPARAGRRASCGRLGTTR
jgi:cation-transporting ATPase F